MKKVFLWGYYGNANIGDDILLSIIVAHIKEKYPNYKITVNVKDKNITPSLPINMINFKANSKNKIFYYLSLLKFYTKVLKQNDIIVFGGGTQIFDNSKYKWKSIFVKANILVINKFLFHRKVIHYGIGIGTLKTSLGHLFAKIIIKSSDYFIVRDFNSFKRLEDLGINKKKMCLSRDLVYGLYNKKINTNNISTHKKIKIGFSLFEYYKYTEIDIIRNEQFNHEIVKLLTKLSETNKYEIFLFSFQKKYGNKDEEFVKNIKRIVNSKNIKIIPYSNINNVLIELDNMDICIGMRYHFIVLSLIKQKPTIAISYANKVRNEMMMFELNDYMLELKDLKKEKIINMINKIIFDKNIQNKKDELNKIKKLLKISKNKFQRLIK